MKKKKMSYLSKSPSLFNNGKIKENYSLDTKTKDNNNQQENDYSKSFNNINNKNKISKTINTKNDEEKEKIYKMLYQTLYNLCDNKGYIYFKDFISLAEELVLEYNISSQLNEMIKEIKIIMKSSLLPGKFHIKDILKIMENKKYDMMYYNISHTLKKKPSSIISQSIHLSQCVKKRSLKQEEDKNNYDNENENNNYMNYQLKLKKNQEYSKNNDISQTNDGNNKYKNNNIYNNNENNNFNKNKDYQILNTLKIKTPFLSVYKTENIDKESNDNNIIDNNNDDNKLNKGCFNILFQSFSELNKTPDLNNQLFLQNFIYFINHISFPIHFNEVEQSFMISISSLEKEYKFIQAFMNNFKMINFELNKWYCHNYYKQIFEDFESYEFLFEHSLLIFYSYYNEIIDNFFNDIHQVQDCYLMIEDNPLNLIEPKSNQDTPIVMLVLIQWKEKTDKNKQIENIVYNKNDNRYYFKNPFNWIGNYNNKNEFKFNSINTGINGFNILVPVYIFSNIEFNNNDDNSSFINLYANINNKTFL